MKLSARTLKIILNCWPPFWGAGIGVETITKDFSFARVSMVCRWYNKNYMRTQFGGSLYSMTDPFFALLLIQKLGPKYVVWDKAGEITYIKPGKTKVYADFKLTAEQVEAIKQATRNIDDKTLPVFYTAVYDENKELIASIKKTLYVKRLRED